MWQVDYYIAIEQELARQRDLDRRRALSDAVRPQAPGGARLGGLRRLLSPIGRLAHGFAAALGRLAHGFAAALGATLDRPAVGTHHL